MFCVAFRSFCLPFCKTLFKQHYASFSPFGFVLLSLFKWQRESLLRPLHCPAVDFKRTYRSKISRVWEVKPRPILPSLPFLSNPARNASSLFLSSSFLCLHLLFVPSPGFRLLSSSLSLPCCVRIGSDSLQKAGLQPRLLALGLQGQFEARSWWRECKYRPA